MMRLASTRGRAYTSLTPRPTGARALCPTTIRYPTDARVATAVHTSGNLPGDLREQPRGLERDGAEDQACRTCGEDGSRAVERADASAELDGDRQPLGDRAQRLEMS